MGNANRTICLFAASGFASGLASAWLFSPGNLNIEFTGVLFASSIAACAIIARCCSWIEFSCSIKRCLLSGMLVSASAPAAIWAVSLAHIAFQFSCGRIFANYLCAELTSSEIINLLLLIVPTDIMCVALVSVGLRVITQRFRLRQLAVLLLTTTGAMFSTIWVSFLLDDLRPPIWPYRQDSTFFIMWSVLGQLSLAVGCATWMLAGSLRPARDLNF